MVVVVWEQISMLRVRPTFGIAETRDWMLWDRINDSLAVLVELEDPTTMAV